ncbi:Arylsulfatase [compost metagenome]
MAGELFGNAYYREGDLKLLGLRPQVGFGENAKPLQWQLFDMRTDRGETTDLATSQPQTVQRLEAAWLEYAKKVGIVFAGQ